MSEAAVFVGVDIGGTQTRAAAMTSQGDIGELARSPLVVDAAPDVVLGRIVDLVETVVAGAPARLAGIGLAVSGPVDTVTGIVSNPWTLPSLAGVDIRSPFEHRFGVPVGVDNDADAAALGEYVRGAGAGVDSLAMVTLGTGLGVALVSGGEVLRGAGGTHPEAGHHSVAADGPTCYCGLVGCWEALCSGTALERRARAAIEDGTWRPARPLRSASDVTAAADAGDPQARALLEELGFHVGRGLRNIEAFYAPALILVGGGLGRRLDLLAAGIDRGRAPASLLSPRASVAPAALGDAAGAVGAACSIRSRLEG